MFLSILCYRKIIHNLAESPVYSLSKFGFEKGATFELFIKEVDPPHQISLFLLNQNETHKLPRYINNVTDICNPENKFEIFKLNMNVSTDVLNGTIQNAGAYTPYVADCSATSQQSNIHIVLSVSFQNPSTHLDTRQVLSLKIIPMVVFTATILLTVWVFNWISHCSVKIPIHRLLTSVFFVTYAEFVLHYFLIAQLHKSDDPKGIDIIYILVKGIAHILTCIFLLYASKGWCIIRDHVKLSELLLSAFYSIVFIGLSIIRDYLYLGKFSVFIVLVTLIFIGLFIRELIMSINDASLHIMAHMLVIQNMGIDASSTPIALKHHMYQFFQWTVVGGCICVVLYLCVDLGLELDPWISDLVSAAGELALYALVGFTFRLRASDTTGYGAVGLRDGEQIEVALDDIEEASVKPGEGVKWEEGMELPGQPRVVNTAPAVVTIASPGGTERLEAEVAIADA